jgi:hypothetical protein
MLGTGCTETCRLAEGHTASKIDFRVAALFAGHEVRETELDSPLAAGV